jgi:hypothetical protein
MRIFFIFAPLLSAQGAQHFFIESAFSLIRQCELGQFTNVCTGAENGAYLFM